MLLRAYLPKLITALFGGLFIAAGIITFNDAVLFDRIFLGVLIFTAVICRKDVDVLGVILIIFLTRAVEELVWLHLNESGFIKILIYLACLSISFYLRHNWASKIFLGVSLLTSFIEIYWLSIEYDPPEIYWNMILVAITLISRNLIFSRVSITEHYFKKFQPKSINLDWIIYKLFGLSLIIQIIVVLEYVIRHLFDLPKLVIFYYASVYAIRAIGTLSIWAIFNESYKQLAPKFLKA